MADLGQNLTATKEKSLAEKIKVFATIVGIISPIIALATFIGLKPEKKKVLEWEYVSKSSLVNTSAASSDKIEVHYEGRKIKQLSVVTARLFNSGSISIDASDVKDLAYPTVLFPSNVNVIGAEIKSRSPSDLRAQIFYQGNQVRVENGLFNPTDSVTIQILLEGDPGEIAALPPVQYRIAGIVTPTTRYSSPPIKRTNIAYFQMPSVTEYIVLVLASLLPLICVVGGAITFVREITQGAFPEKKIAAFFSKATAKDSPSASAAEIKDLLAREMFVRLSPPLDGRARDVIKKVEILPSESKQQLIEKIKIKLQAEFTPKNFAGRLKAIDKSALFGMLVIFALGAASMLVIFGSWSNRFTR